MLSVNKIKLHDMQDNRWTVTDKLTQYKGIINLFTRDCKVHQYDKSIKRKKQKLLLKKLQRDVARSKKELDNAIKGDQQNIRNALAAEKPLQQAFQGLSPTDVVEKIHQYNFTKRKELDRLKFNMKLKKEKLIEKKMELSLIEDREIYKKYFDKMPIGRHAEIITGKVQDATLRKEAALSVHYTYARILNILKKDSFYFDAVLRALSLDLFNQGKCMYSTTELGQLATEYLDDRKEELTVLEKAIKSDMEERRHSLKLVKSEVKKLTKNLRSLIRRESDINIGNKSTENTDIRGSITDNIQTLEAVLRQLQTETMVPNFEAIFPCLYAQKTQQDRLEEFVTKLTNSKEVLSHKKDYAEVQLDSLYFTMVDTTFEYMQQKKKMKAQIKQQTSNYDAIKYKALKKGELMVLIRSSLQHLHMILKPLGYISERRVTAFYREKEESEEDFSGTELLGLLNQKLHILMSLCGTKYYRDQESEQEAHYMFQDLVLKGCRTVQVKETATPDNLLEGLVLEETTILNRSDIKAQSENIVKEYRSMAIELPPPPLRRRLFK